MCRGAGVGVAVGGGGVACEMSVCVVLCALVTCCNMYNVVTTYLSK
jgi:hypothetical protein